MNSLHFQGKPFNITVIQVYAPTSNAEEAEVEWVYEYLQDILEISEINRQEWANLIQMTIISITVGSNHLKGME